MKVTGYSGKPLVNKLGYQPDNTVLVHAAPGWFVQELTMRDILTNSTLPTTWAHLFFTRSEDLRQYMDHFALDEIQKAIWISWPKKTSKVPTDITEQTLRDIILPLGWVDVKVAAIDKIWSGLKFMRRVSNTKP